MRQSRKPIPQPEQASQVTAGSLILVSYGNNGGTQIARIIEQRERYWIGAKWLRNGRRWTDRLSIPKSTFIRIATPRDIKGAKVPVDA